MSGERTAPCIDCGKLVAKWLGADARYGVGVKTADGYRCSACYGKRTRGAGL